MVFASGQYCVQSLQLVCAQMSTLMSATRYIGSPFLQDYALAAAAASARLVALLTSSQPLSAANFQPAAITAMFFSMSSCFFLNFLSTTLSNAAVPPDTTNPLPRNRSFTA